MSIGYGVKIIIEDTGQEFHSLNDWGLVIGNNNYIGTPIQETNYVTVPGAFRNLDLSEVITGKPVFKSREINVLLGGLKNRLKWDNIISEFRNYIEGRVVHLIFDNDSCFYWRGRVEIANFDRVRELGSFNLRLSMADPYKYDVFDSEDEWEWDPFDFEYGVIRYIGPIEINNTSITVPKGNMEVVPVFIIDSIVSATLTVTVNGTTYSLVKGENRFPQLKVAGETEVILQFTGIGKGTVKYRGGSL